MVSALVVGALGIYLSFKYGLLTQAKRDVFGAAAIVGPTSVLLLLRLAVWGAARAYDVILVVASVLPILWPGHIGFVVTGLVALLGGLVSMQEGEPRVVGGLLFATAAIAVGVEAARWLRRR